MSSQRVNGKKKLLLWSLHGYKAIPSPFTSVTDKRSKNAVFTCFCQTHFQQLACVFSSQMRFTQPQRFSFRSRWCLLSCSRGDWTVHISTPELMQHWTPQFSLLVWSRVGNSGWLSQAEWCWIRVWGGADWGALASIISSTESDLLRFACSTGWPSVTWRVVGNSSASLK